MDTAALARQLAEMDKVATPGPWHWDSDDVKNDKFCRKQFQVTSRGKTVTRIYYSSYEGGRTSAEFDAAIISSLRSNLPAILRALCVMAAVEEGSKRYGIGSVHHGINKRADELLAECTGAK